MNLQLDDQVVMITGGAGSLGSAAARSFLEEGAMVAMADLPCKAQGPAVTSLLSEFPGRAMFIELDLCDASSIEGSVARVLQQFGAINVVVHNAATFHFAPLNEWGQRDPLEHHFQVGLCGPLRLMREVWKHHPDALRGSVVIISSIAGHVGEPDSFAYTPIKAAQKGLTLSCAQEMAPHGGWAVCVSPGHIWSDIHKSRAAAAGLSREGYEATMPNIQTTLFGRFLEAEEIARWIVVAASSLGKAITGQDLHATLGVETGGFHKNYKTTLPK